jgi:hypothetical protein
MPGRLEILPLRYVLRVTTDHRFCYPLTFSNNVMKVTAPE